MNEQKQNNKLTLLSQGETDYPQNPKEAKLETFTNPTPKSNYTIEFETEEFTSLCPVTGQPDFAKIHIKYSPDKKCIESKSLKLYLFSYRNYKGFAEKIINSIKEDLVRACKPRKLEVNGYFRARGGITITVNTEYKKMEGGKK